MKSSIIRFSVSLPQNLLETLDERLTHKGYSSRSEIVRDMIREKLNEEIWSSGAESCPTIRCGAPCAASGGATAR